MSSSHVKPASFLGGLLSLIGLSTAVGILISAAFTPLLALTASAVNSGIDLFSSLPAYATINQQVERNIIYGQRDGKPEEIARFYSQNREVITLQQVSLHAQNAAVAAEDRRFYSHGGVDAQSLGRAVLSQFGFGADSGASTLTMQLVRQQIIMDAFQRGDDETIAEQRSENYNRKLREIKLAIGLEQNYTKDEILLAYLNIANFGGTIYGIQTASQSFFGVPASKLSPAQAASLIATVQSPAALTLMDEENWERNQVRRDWVLAQMHDEGYLTDEQYEKAIATPVDEKFVNFKPVVSGCVSGHESGKFACAYVQQVLLKDKVGENYILAPTEDANRVALDQGGYRIYTSIDLELSDRTQAIVREVSPPEEDRWESGAAVTMIEVGTGRILTMVQNKYYDPTESADYTGTGVNFNVTEEYGGGTGFQPGSMYKVFTLAAWVKNGYSVEEVLDTTKRPRTLRACGDAMEPYDPQNNAGLEFGRVSVTRVLQDSINTGTIEMATRLDICDIQQTAADMGFQAANHPDEDLSIYPSALIGGAQDNATPLTMAEVFATMANDGVHCTPVVLDRVVDREGREISVPQSQCNRVLTSEQAAVVQHVLTKVTEWNFQNNPGMGVPVISKTGTSENVEQNWLAEASPRVAGATWTGNIQGNVNLEPWWDAPKDIMRRAMVEAITLYPGGEFTKPDEKTLRGNLEQLPDVAGMTVEDAKRALKDAGFENVEVADRVEGSQEKGRIEYSAPGAGSPLAQDAKVMLYPSDGSKREKEKDKENNSSASPSAAPSQATDGSVWPDLTSLPFSEAKRRVTAAGFNADHIQVSWYQTDASQQCVVLAQNPAAGAAASPNDPISIVLGSETGQAVQC